MICEGQIYNWKHIADAGGWRQFSGRTVVDVIKITEVAFDNVSYRIGSHAGNLTSPIISASIKDFMSSIKSKEYELVKDVPLVYVPPINRLDLVDCD